MNDDVSLTMFDVDNVSSLMKGPHQEAALQWIRGSLQSVHVPLVIRPCAAAGRKDMPPPDTNKDKVDSEQDERMGQQLFRYDYPLTMSHY